MLQAKAAAVDSLEQEVAELKIRLGNSEATLQVCEYFLHTQFVLIPCEYILCCLLPHRLKLLN